MKPEPTRFGAFIHARRKILGRTLTRIAKDAGCSASYLSKLETGAAQSMPSRDMLVRLARALEILPVHLQAQLESDTAGSPQLIGHTSSTPTNLTPSEHRLLATYRALDKQLRQVLLRDAQFYSALKGRAVLADGFDPELARAGKSGSQAAEEGAAEKLAQCYSELARAYQELAETCFNAGLDDQSIHCFKAAESILLQQTGQAAKAAVVQYRIARTHHRLALRQDADLPAKEHSIYNAEVVCAEADRAFRDTRSRDPRDVSDEIREYQPAVLAIWAAIIQERLRWLEADTTLSDEDKVATRYHYQSLVRAKRQDAERLYAQWLVELEHRDAKVDPSLRLMQARTLHRLGIIKRLRASDEPDARLQYSTEARDHFERCIRIYRELLLDPQHDQAEMKSRLAYSHFELAELYSHHGACLGNYAEWTARWNYYLAKAVDTAAYRRSWQLRPDQEPQLEHYEELLADLRNEYSNGTIPVSAELPIILPDPGKPGRMGV